MNTNTAIRHTLAVALACALLSPLPLLAQKTQDTQDATSQSDATQQTQPAVPETDAAQQAQSTTDETTAEQDSQATAPEAAAEPQPPAAMPKMGAEQQAMMQAWQKAMTPGPQHQQLAEHFVGKWNVKQTIWMDPSAPPMTQTGTDTSEAVLGGRQIRSDFTGTFMGQPFHGIGYTGYDNVTKRYTSTWIDDMSTGTMLAYGDYDPATRTYTYKTEMADPMKDGAKTPLRMTVRIVDADHHVFDMYEMHDGKEAHSIQMEYVRAE